jgi:hypothetical protein
LGGTGSKDREIIRRYLTSLFTSKIVVHGERSIPALEVPELFFVQGSISACGDALLLSDLSDRQGPEMDCQR